MPRFGENLMPSQTEKPSRIGSFKESLKPDFVKRRQAEEELKKRGFESFDDVRMGEIRIDSIKKELRSTDHSLEAFFKKSPKTESVQKVTGSVEAEALLLGDQKRKFLWEAGMERHNELRQGIVWNVEFSLWDPGDTYPFYSSDEKFPAVPRWLKENSERMGIASSYKNEIRESRGYESFLNIIRTIKERVSEYVEEKALSRLMTYREFDGANFLIRNELSAKTDEELQKELLESLVKGEVDGKFLYIMGGAENFLELMKAEDHEVSEEEKRLIEIHAEEIANEIRNELLDFGCGDGLKSKILLEKISEREEQTKYRPVDISHRIISEASANFTGANTVEGVLLDFTKPLPKDIKTAPESTFAILGNTLGNGDRQYQEILMQNMAKAMKEGDNMLIGVQLNHNFDEILEKYKNPKVSSFAYPMLEKLGIQREDADVYISDEKENQMIILNLKLLRDKTVQLGGNQVFLPEGKNIRLIISHKYEIPEMDHLAEISGLRIKKNFVSDDSSHALFLLEK